MKQVTMWEKLKLQVDNIEAMYRVHEAGEDVSTQIYWQVEYLHELLEVIENATGADKIRGKYDSLSGN